jgi:L-ascorbate metabolism protein UlaG (beta-lactamase superfamily)
MKPFIFFLLIGSFLLSQPVSAQKSFEYVMTTTEGNLLVKVLGHASVVFEWNNRVIYVDPYSAVYDFSTLPKADLILITHEHDDHFDAKALNKIKTDSIQMVYTLTCRNKGAYSGQDSIMGNGDSITIEDIAIRAVPAYNIVRPRHVKGVGNGYILTFADKRVYVAGDTEVLPEMSTISDIDLAILGYSKYNMDDAMFVETISVIKPAVVIPCHYDNASIASLINAVGAIQGVTMLTDTPATSSGTLFEKPKETVFPNPVSERLNGSMFHAGSTVLVMDISGKLVATRKVTCEGVFDVSELRPGAYMLSVENKGSMFTSQFIVSR